MLLAATWVRNHKLKANRKQLMLEHKLLRLQMNPHFLFNSLSSIQNVIIRSDKMEAATLVANFSKFIRFILESSRSNLVPLDNEIEAINIFLDLQKVRFPNLFSHSIQVDIDELASEVLVPPLIVQPFVENSVIHGFPKDRNDGKLDIHFFRSNGNLCCRVKDNGIGFKSNFHKKEGTHKSLATQITTERLELISKRYNRKASLVYEDLGDNEQGTSLLITLPLLFNDLEN
jgi:LytS/YehU family sensor histidine kinase